MLPRQICVAWYEKEGDELGGEVSRMVDGFRRSQRGRRTRYLYNLSLFEKRRIVGASTDYCNDEGEFGSWSEDDRLGLIRSAVQTAVAELYARQKPKPQFQTTGADWRIRRRAKKLDKFCEGVLHQRQGRWQNVWSLMQDAAIEAAIHGVAAIRVLPNFDQKRIEHELTPHIDLFTDPLEGREPQNLFLAQPMDVERAIQTWVEDESLELTKKEKEERKRAINGAPEYWRFKDSPDGGSPRASRVIRQDSGWRLPLGEDKPGKYVVSIGGIVMCETEWEAPFFPFVFLRWEDHRDGFWGSGLADEGRVLARDAGELDWRLLHRTIVASGKRTFVHADALVNDQDLLGNDAETIIKVNPGMQFPQEGVVSPLAPGEPEYLQSRKQAFWDSVGISQVSAAARREQGIESAVAIRTLNDTKAGRQLQKAQRYEQAFVDLAHQYVWRMKELSEVHPDVTVTWPGKSILNEVKWSDADPADHTFFTQVAPASNLPNDPAGRQQMVQELFKSGLITGETAKSLIGWPDFEKDLQTSTAESEYLDMLLDRYLDAEEAKFEPEVDYESPNGMITDKPRALLRFSQTYFQSKIEKAPEFNLQLLKRYISELNDEIAAMQPPPAPPGPPMGPPMGAPPPPG